MNKSSDSSPTSNGSSIIEGSIIFAKIFRSVLFPTPDGPSVVRITIGNIGSALYFSYWIVSNTYSIGFSILVGWSKNKGSAFNYFWFIYFICYSLSYCRSISIFLMINYYFVYLKIKEIIYFFINISYKYNCDNYFI